MDFFGILFDMKNGKKIPYSKNYFDTLFAENLAGVTTLTGTLPLTFTTSETKLRSWTIYGADIEHIETASGKSITFHTDEDKLRDWTIYGNDNVGKNKFETPNISETWYTVKWSVENGVLKGVGTYNESAPHTRPRLQGQLPAGSYILSGSPDYTTTNIRLQIGTCTDSRGNNFAILGYDEGSGFSFTLQADSWVSVRVWTDAALYQQAIDVSIPIMIRPADTSADFEPYQIGIGQRTKNLLEITATTREINGVTFTIDKEAGTITANGTADQAVYLNLPIDAPSGDYYYSGCALGGSASTYDLFAWDNTISGRPKKWDGETNVDSDNGGTSQEIKVDSEHSMRLTIRIRSGQTVNNLVFKPMLRLPDTSADFVPYGYEIPLTVNNTPQDIYIGSTPLTAGQSVSKTSTGVDIATTDGNNTITTTLYNQPDMSITYNEYTGVGIPTANLFMIALKLKAGGQTLNVFNTLMNKPLRAGETLTSEQTGQTINTVAGVENKLSPAPKVASYGGSFNMTIKYKE